MSGVLQPDGGDFFDATMSSDDDVELVSTGDRMDTRDGKHFSAAPPTTPMDDSSQGANNRSTATEVATSTAVNSGAYTSDLDPQISARRDVCAAAAEMRAQAVTDLTDSPQSPAPSVEHLQRSAGMRPVTLPRAPVRAPTVHGVLRPAPLVRSQPSTGAMQQIVDCFMPEETHRTPLTYIQALCDASSRAPPPGLDHGFFSGDVDSYTQRRKVDATFGCGYRNLQVMLSFLQRQGPEYADAVFQGRGVPNVATLQRAIEVSWRDGFDVEGAKQLGWKLHGTSTWIGSSDAAGLLRFLGFDAVLLDFNCNAALMARAKAQRVLDCIRSASARGDHQAVARAQARLPQLWAAAGGEVRVAGMNTPAANAENATNAGLSRPVGGAKGPTDAGRNLLRWVWCYFSRAAADGGAQPGSRQRWTKTKAGPLYLQYQGHSTTIVGVFRRRPNGQPLIPRNPRHSTSVTAHGKKGNQPSQGRQLSLHNVLNATGADSTQHGAEGAGDGSHQQRGTATYTAASNRLVMEVGEQEMSHLMATDDTEASDASGSKVTSGSSDLPRMEVPKLMIDIDGVVDDVLASLAPSDASGAPCSMPGSPYCGEPRARMHVGQPLFQSPAGLPLPPGMASPGSIFGYNALPSGPNPYGMRPMMPTNYWPMAPSPAYDLQRMHHGYHHGSNSSATNAMSGDRAYNMRSPHSVDVAFISGSTSTDSWQSTMMNQNQHYMRGAWTVGSTAVPQQQHPMGFPPAVLGSQPWANTYMPQLTEPCPQLAAQVSTDHNYNLSGYHDQMRDLHHTVPKARHEHPALDTLAEMPWSARRRGAGPRSLSMSPGRSCLWWGEDGTDSVADQSSSSAVASARSTDMSQITKTITHSLNIGADSPTAQQVPGTDGEALQQRPRGYGATRTITRTRTANQQQQTMQEREERAARGAARPDSARRRGGTSAHRRGARRHHSTGRTQAPGRGGFVSSGSNSASRFGFEMFPPTPAGGGHGHGLPSSAGHSSEQHGLFAAGGFTPDALGGGLVPPNIEVVADDGWEYSLIVLDSQTNSGPFEEALNTEHGWKRAVWWSPERMSRLSYQICAVPGLLQESQREASKTLTSMMVDAFVIM